jgi:polyphenol oxidase
LKRLELIQFNIFKAYPNQIQAFTTRKGGFSQGSYASLNMGVSVGDDPLVVSKNRELFFKHISVPKNRLVFPQQVHSKLVKQVIEPGTMNACDALITAGKNLFLTVQTADCFPVFMFNPNQPCVGLVHSGWRGTAGNIVGRAIRDMQRQLGGHPQHLLVGIGPGIQQPNYQVDQEVARYFDPVYLEADGPERYRLNLQRVIFDQIIAEGVPRENIECLNLCTFDREDLFYSYRRDEQKSGRMMGIIGLKS